MVDEQNAETPEEKKKRQRREYMRNYRRKDKPEEPPESFQEISAKWTDNDKRLLDTDAKLHAQLSARHNEVVELEAQVIEILKGVGIYTWPPSPTKRAETFDANTPNPDEIFPMPDICFADVKADVLKNGAANYNAIEAASVKGEQLDAEGEHYRSYGFRLRLSHETLQNALESLVLYSLRTKDLTLDWSLVNEAVSDCAVFNRFSPNQSELRRLIQEHRGL